MGAFDWVNFEAPCVACGKRLNRFQTKDGPQQLAQLEPEDVPNMHTLCWQCGTWNVYRVRTGADLSQVERVRLRLLGKPMFLAEIDRSLEHLLWGISSLK